MRILMVSQMTPYLPCHDGFRLVPAHLLQRLAERHTIALVAVGAAAETPDQRRWAARFCQSVETVAPGPWRQRLRAQPGAGVEAVRAAVARTIARFGPDVMHVEGSMLAPLCREGGVPTVLAVHDSRTLRAREFRRLAATPWEWVRARLEEREESAWERRWFPGADTCVVLSEEDRAEIATFVPADRVAVLPNGIDAEHHAFRRNGQAGRIVFTGNFSWPPNVDAACRFATAIFPRVLAPWPRAELILAGANPAPAVRALASLPGVRVTGTVPDLRPSIWGGSVYVSPLRAGFGVKNKILEAMALGTPIVASPRSLSGLPYVVPGRHLLRAETDEDVAAAVLRLLAEPATADALARAARELIERRYTWHVIARRYEELLARAAGARAGDARVSA